MTGTVVSVLLECAESNTKNASGPKNTSEANIYVAAGQAYAIMALAAAVDRIADILEKKQ